VRRAGKRAAQRSEEHGERAPTGPAHPNGGPILTCVRPDAKPSADRLHDLADLRSLEFHRRIAGRLRQDPKVVHRAQATVARRAADCTVARPWITAWGELLTGDREQLLAVLVDPGERATALRQVTPFAGVVPPRERRQIWRQARERWEAGPP
jgi:hypothetical protein